MRKRSQPALTRSPIWLTGWPGFPGRLRGLLAVIVKRGRDNGWEQIELPRRGAGGRHPTSPANGE